MAYTDIATVKRYMGDTWTAGDDTLLTELIADAAALIDDYCGRTFEAAADATRYFDAARDIRGRRLTFDQDIYSITSVVNGDGATIASTNYFLEPANTAPKYAITLKSTVGAAWLPTSGGDTEQAIAVTGRWAYAATVPATIARSAVYLVTWMYRQRSDTSAAAHRPILTDGAVIMPQVLPSYVLRRLNQYKRISL